MFGIIFKNKSEIDFSQIPNRELQMQVSRKENVKNTKQKRFEQPLHSPKY